MTVGTILQAKSNLQLITSIACEELLLDVKLRRYKSRNLRSCQENTILGFNAIFAVNVPSQKCSLNAALQPVITIHNFSCLLKSVCKLCTFSPEVFKINIVVLFLPLIFRLVFGCLQVFFLSNFFEYFCILLFGLP